MPRKILAALTAVVLVASCSRGTPGVKDGPADSGPSAGTNQESRFPEGGIVQVTQREGASELLRGPDAIVLEIGTRLALGDGVRTGPDGTAEVLLGDLASFRLLPASEISVRSVVFAEGGSRAEIFVNRGSVLFSVRRLAPRESFVVSTSRAIAGVRGTQFVVSAGEAATVAVREGRVAVLPTGPVLDRIVGTSRTNAVARAALRGIMESAPVAGPSQEIRVDPAAQIRAEEGFAKLEAFLSGLTAVPLGTEFPEEPWFSEGEPSALPAPDASSERSLSLAREAAGEVRPYLAVPVSAGAETLRGFERFKDFRSGPAAATPSPGPSAPAAHPSVLGRTALSSVPLAGSVVRVPDLGVLISADEAGFLHAFDADGRVLWSLRTANRGDPRTYPVTYKGVAYYAGNAELIAVDGKSGAVLARRALEPGLKTGERPSPFPDALLLPTDSGFDLLNPQTLEVKSSIPVAGGPGTLPTQRDSFALIVNKEGDLLLMDPTEGSIRARTPTGARGSAAVSPRVFEDKACFADRTGLVVLVNLEEMKVLWERPTGAEVLTDIEMAKEGVLAYGNGTLFGFRLDGESLMTPVTGVSAPPLLSRGTVFYGTSDGDLVVAQASPWRIRGKISLGDTPSARPLQVGDTLYVGTRSGRLVRLDANKFPE